MLVDKLYNVKVAARNKPAIVGLFLDPINVNDIISITAEQATIIGSTILLDCICDRCSTKYSIHAYRIKKLPNRKSICGKCASHDGMLNMCKTKRLNENREKYSKLAKEFYSTSGGISAKQKAVRSWRKYYRENKELVSIRATNNLQHYSGINHPRWNANKSQFKKYHSRVTSITKRNDLTLLDNYEYRGMAGLDGKYHLDHIVSVKHGFEQHIPPEIIGAKENLRFIPWE